MDVALAQALAKEFPEIIFGVDPAIYDKMIFHVYGERDLKIDEDATEDNNQPSKVEFR